MRQAVDYFARMACGMGTCALGLSLASPACAQVVAPSSVTPQTLRPPAVDRDAPPELPPPAALTPPSGTADLTVRPGAVTVIGAFPELADEAGAIANRLVGRTVTLAEIYAAAAGIEALHVRRGYILARATLPPQQIDDGGTVTILVTDGFIERIDTTRLPARLQAPVRRRVAGLQGRRRLTLADIEAPVMRAGEVPGVTLASTLSRGAQPGGVLLHLSGRYAPVRGSLTIDNSLVPSLGRAGVTAQLSLNSLLGQGEQVYGFVATGSDISRVFSDDAQMRVLGGGVIVPLGNGRLSLNPEITASRTQPSAQPGVPRIRGTLARVSLRGTYVLIRSRHRSLSGGVTIERISETSDAIDFGVTLSRDRFDVVRAQLSYASALPGGGVSLTAQLSQGLGGRDGQANPASRQGASADFTRAHVSVRLWKAITPRLTLALTARGQTSFGAPLFRSEQGTLEGVDALSAYIGGITSADSNVTLRGEVSREPWSFGAIRVSPYVFAGAGTGWIERPTAVEQRRYTLYNPGLGLRGALAGGQIGVTIEYGHGLSVSPAFDGVDRVSAALTLGF